ncbi:MAG: GAF domain-containing protein [Proteobacteria bacterium]|nr:GAF domain-containing protein [Pseudomonadota bacterium]
MRVTFHGVRGSMAAPGPATVRFGGNTSCVSLRSDSGTLVLLDVGTGAAPLGRELIASGEPLKGHILISHTHWDHIQGLPFFGPLFVPGAQWDIYAPRGLGAAVRETLAAQMQHDYFPVDLDQLGANIVYHDLVEGELQLGDVRVTAHYLNHPALTLGYRLQVDGATLVYSCDHEPHDRALAGGEGEVTGADARHVEFLAKADLVIHDAQYTAAEYESKVGWGHSTVDYAIAMAKKAGAKRLALTHHDPTRSDDDLDAVLADLRSRMDFGNLEVFAAAEGQTFELRRKAVQKHEEGFRADTALDGALTATTILAVASSGGVADPLREALDKEQLPYHLVAADDAEAALSRERPGLILLEATSDAAALAERIRARSPDAPIMALVPPDGWPDGIARFTDEEIAAPFSSSYARARIRAALLRHACRWVRAEPATDEEARLASLRELRILDTPPEERFDRITRLAAALFDVPTALISLVDENRQWFKSTCGLDAKETPRDESFCAHAVASRDILIVPDALRDDRFADNPVVVGPARVRFYAGHPLFASDGACLGTLCILDRRPRDLDAAALQNLKDLAAIAADELEAGRRGSGLRPPPTLGLNVV